MGIITPDRVGLSDNTIVFVYRKIIDHGSERYRVWEDITQVVPISEIKEITKRHYTKRIYKEHPTDEIQEDLKSAPTYSVSTRDAEYYVPDYIYKELGKRYGGEY